MRCFLIILGLVLTGVCIGVSVYYLQVLFALKKIPLTMAEDSYDDQYFGCPSEMENKLMDTSTDAGFNKMHRSVWENATKHWKKIKASLQLPSGFKDKYGIAIAAYTDNSTDLYKIFNTAVRAGGKSYNKSFQFKSFHFLLTKAIQALSASQSGCYNVYRGVKGVRFTVSDRKNLVRLGQFASSSLSENVSKRFGNDTFFTIKTCHGANIRDFSFFPHQEEVLIPPYETFTIVGSNDKGQIKLESSSKKSYFNCQSKQDPSSLTLGVPTAFFLWGFLFFSGAFHSIGSL